MSDPDFKAKPTIPTCVSWLMDQKDYGNGKVVDLRMIIVEISLSFE